MGFLGSNPSVSVLVGLGIGRPTSFEKSRLRKGASEFDSPAYRIEGRGGNTASATCLLQFLVKSVDLFGRDRKRRHVFHFARDSRIQVGRDDAMVVKVFGDR